MEFKVQGKTAYAYTGGKAFDAKLPGIVFVHGGEQDHSVWALQSRYLAHHGYGVLAIDLPGHGRSDGPALARIEDMAEWIVALIDSLGMERVALIGHSMGSLVAVECAARHPRRVSRIALLGTAFPMRVSPELLDAAKNGEQAAHEMINIWSHSTHAHYPGNPGPGFWVAGGNLRLMQRQKPGVLHTDFAACNDYGAGLGSAAKVKCPALALIGGRDQMTPPRAARELIRSIPGCRAIEIADSGHAMMAERPDEVLEALRGFLAEQTATA